MKNKAKIFLISPPRFFGTAPLLGIPVVKAYLRKQGVQCDSVDLNIRFIYWLLGQGRFFEEASKDIIGAFRQFQEKQELKKEEIPDFIEILNLMSLFSPYLLKKYLNNEVIEGSPYEKKPETLVGNALSMTYILHSNRAQGIVPGRLSELALQRSGELQKFRNSFKQFLASPEIHSILEQASQADIVGFSITHTHSQLEPALIIARRIRQLNPGVFTILGGAGITGLSENKNKEILLSNKFINAIGLHRGENLLLQLASAVEGGKDIKDVPNLLYYNQITREFIRTGFQDIRHPDDLPTPEFNDDEVKLYFRLSSKWCPGVRLPVFVSRGCYWGKCAFCGDQALQKSGSTGAVHRSVEKVLEDIQNLKNKHNASYFYLITPAMAPQWAKHFSAKIVEEGIAANFWSFLRPGNRRTLDRKFFIRLKQAGFDFISLGIESVCQRVLNAVNKGTTVEEIKYTIQGLSSTGIRTRFNLILDLPPTTVEESIENWKFVNENISFIEDLTVFHFNLFEGTPMAKEPGKFGIKPILNDDGTPAYINPYTLDCKLPFYDIRGAKKMDISFQKLARNLQFYRLTKESRERITAEGFSWEHCSVLFRPFTAIPARFSTGDNKRREKTYYMFLEDFYKIVEIPGCFSDLIALFQKAVKEPVENIELIEAFHRGVKESGYRKDQDDESLTGSATWNRVLARFVYEGFIQDIFNDPCFPYIDIKTGRKTIPPTRTVEKTQEPLPFRFVRNPFAGVPQTKVI